MAEITNNGANNVTNNLKSKKTKYIGIAAVVILALWLISGYNGLVSKDESVSQAWANVQTDYQRRANLIPNLVKMIRKYTDYEGSTLKGVVAERSKATQVTIDASDLTEEKLQEFQKSRNELEATLGKLLAITEAYPELKASKQFEQFNVQLEGTENRIKKSLDDFNKAVTDYNLKVRRFPGSIIASIFGFDKKAKFEAEVGADKAPDIDEI